MRLQIKRKDGNKTMVIDVILDHLSEVESYENPADKKLTKQEIDWLKAYEFDYINNVFELPKEQQDYELKKAFIRYLVEQDYNIEIAARILSITWL